MYVALPDQNPNPAVSPWLRRFILVTKVSECVCCGVRGSLSACQVGAGEPVPCGWPASVEHGRARALRVALLSECLQLLVLPSLFTDLDLLCSPLFQGPKHGLATGSWCSNPFSAGDHPVAFASLLCDIITEVVQRGHKNEFMFETARFLLCVNINFSV